VSRTALAFANPKYWNLEYAMGQWYQAFEGEGEKPDKAFHELVRQRRRALGLPVPPEGRVLPFRAQPSASLPALDIAIDRDSDEAETLTPAQGEPANRTEQRLALLRVARRLEELDIALDAATHAAQASPTSAMRRRVEELERACPHELQVYEAIHCKIGRSGNE
jgi:hypothetical protein